ncbi:MAG: GAF domain-containing protein [Anaerolineales bacterium]
MSNKNQIQTFFTNLYQDSLEKFDQDFRETDPRKIQGITQIALIGAIASWLALPIYILGQALTGQIQFQSLAYNNLILAIGLSITYLLARLKIKMIPALLTALLVEVTFIRANFYIDGLGIILGIILLAIVINVAVQGFSTKPAIFVIITAVLTAGVCIAIDMLNLPAGRIESPFWLQQAVTVMGGLVVLFVSINLLNSLEFDSIRTQLSLSSLIIAVVPIATVLAVAFLSQNQELRALERQELQKVVFLLADEVNLQMAGLSTKVENEARIPAMHKYFTGQQTRIEILETLSVLSGQSRLVLSYGLLDTQGNIRVDTLPFFIGQNEADSEWFQETISRQTGHISKVYYEENLVRPVFYVSAPILHEGELVGVLRVQYDGDFLREMLRSRANRLDPGFMLILIDQSGIILAHTSQPSLQQKTVSILTDEQLIALQSTGQLPKGTAQSLSTNLPELSASLLNSPAGGDVFSAPLEQDGTIKANFATANITGKNWYLVAGQPETFNVLSLIQRNMGLIVVIAFILLTAIFAVTNTTRWITAPINSLVLMAQAIGRGNLNVSSGISRTDELGNLARSFDDTATQLKSTLQNLEERVDERTKELAQANELATQRTEQLKVVSTVALAVNKLQNLQILLPQITEEISKAFGVYHVGIFLIDPSAQYAVLQAANSEGGRQMLSRGHRLRVGQVGIVGFVTGFGRGRIALDVGDDATFFNNPDLPQTRSEMALPLKSGNTVIGALDLQSEKPAAFSQEDIDSLSLLADQISTAIENARMFEETQAALSEARLVFSKNVHDSWREILSTEKSGFRFANGKIFESEEETQSKQTTNNENLLELPIVIRGETLGNLKIKGQAQREWSEQDVRILQSIVDRIGFALENARLLRNAQRLVSKEQLIGDISDKISRSANVDSILQTAIEELGHIIADSEVTIQVGEHEDMQA